MVESILYTNKNQQNLMFSNVKNHCAASIFQLYGFKL